MIERVFALSYARMKELLHLQPELLESEYFISVLNSEDNKPQAQLLPPDSSRLLTLRFDDVDNRLAAEVAGVADSQFVIFGVEHADRIIDLVLAAQASDASVVLLVNCGAGMCRSGAIARFVRDVLRLDYEQFRRDNPQITPNDLVLRALINRWMERNA
jgi:predicted protein tyrosine phosphatase